MVIHTKAEFLGERSQPYQVGSQEDDAIGFLVSGTGRDDVDWAAITATRGNESISVTGDRRAVDALTKCPELVVWLVVKRYNRVKDGRFTVEVVGRILEALENEACFGPGTDDFAVPTSSYVEIVVSDALDLTELCAAEDVCEVWEEY